MRSCRARPRSSSLAARVRRFSSAIHRGRSRAPIRAVAETFEHVADDTEALLTRLVAIAGRAHRKGLMSLEAEIGDIDHIDSCATA